MNSVDERPVWEVAMPPGGWGIPWPQCVELARAIPSTEWTLVGGLMVQLHSAAASLPVSRPTEDVDIMLHVETGATSMARVSATLDRIGYCLETSVDGDAPAHRFRRGKEKIDVMIADHAAPRIVPTLGGRRPFQVAGGTQALRRTINCRITIDRAPVLISVPNVLGALVLKGAAYLQDSRDRDRHLDDAAVLCATVGTPFELVAEMRGSDRSRILALHSAMEDSNHKSWSQLEPDDRVRAHDVLRLLAANPQRMPAKRIGRPIREKLPE